MSNEKKIKEQAAPTVSGIGSSGTVGSASVSRHASLCDSGTLEQPAEPLPEGATPFNPERRTRLVVIEEAEHLLVPEDGLVIRDSIISYLKTYQGPTTGLCLGTYKDELLDVAKTAMMPWIDHHGILHVGLWSVYVKEGHAKAWYSRDVTKSNLLIITADLAPPKEGWKVRKMMPTIARHAPH